MADNTIVVFAVVACVGVVAVLAAAIRLLLVLRRGVDLGQSRRERVKK